MLGAYGTSVSTALGLVKDLEYIDGAGEEVIKGGTMDKVVTQEKELSQDTKNAVYLTTAIDVLAVVGLSDQFILQINQTRYI